MDIPTFEENNHLWIEEGYKRSKELGDARKKDIEQKKVPEIPLEEVE